MTHTELEDFAKMSEEIFARKLIVELLAVVELHKAYDIDSTGIQYTINLIRGKLGNEN